MTVVRRLMGGSVSGAGRGVRSIELDGQLVPNHTAPLSDDRNAHNVRVRLG